MTSLSYCMPVSCRHHLPHHRHRRRSHQRCYYRHWRHAFYGACTWKYRVSYLNVCVGERVDQWVDESAPSVCNLLVLHQMMGHVNQLSLIRRQLIFNIRSFEKWEISICYPVWHLCRPVGNFTLFPLHLSLLFLRDWRKWQEVISSICYLRMFW